VYKQTVSQVISTMLRRIRNDVTVVTRSDQSSHKLKSQLSSITKAVSYVLCFSLSL